MRQPARLKAGSGQMAVTIDTLQLAKRMKGAGVPEPQAELFADIFRETREAGLAQLASRADLEALRAALKADLAALETKIAEAKFERLKWIVPLLAAQLLALVGLYFR